MIENVLPSPLWRAICNNLMYFTIFKQVVFYYHIFEILHQSLFSKHKDNLIRAGAL